MTAGAFVLGVVLATAAAAALAMSMVVQRYALASGESHVPLFGVPCRANVVWFLGLVGYGAANGLYVASLQYGPLALMASVFTLLLVFNCVFARCLLGEALTPPKVAGCVVILGGVCLVVVGSPKDVDVDLSASDVARLVAKPLGAAYLACLVGSVAASVAAIGAYERRYPLGAKDGAPPPPPRLDRLMGVVYPGSLGLDEAVAHLSMKAAVSLLGNGHWAAALTWIFSAAWIGASLATLWWLRTVFASVLWPWRVSRDSGWEKKSLPSCLVGLRALRDDARAADRVRQRLRRERALRAGLLRGAALHVAAPARPRARRRRRRARRHRRRARRAPAAVARRATTVMLY